MKTGFVAGCCGRTESAAWFAEFCRLSLIAATKPWLGHVQSRAHRRPRHPTAPHWRGDRGLRRAPLLPSALPDRRRWPPIRQIVGGRGCPQHPLPPAQILLSDREWITCILRPPSKRAQKNRGFITTALRWERSGPRTVLKLSQVGCRNASNTQFC
jgi:hypothetical protein